MSDPSDITISIDVSLTKRSQETVDTLNNLSKALRIISNVSLTTKGNLSGLGEGILHIGDAAKQVITFTTQLAEAMDASGIKLEDVKAAQELLADATGILAAKQQILVMQTNQVKDAFAELLLDSSEEKLKRFSETLKGFSSDGFSAIRMARGMHGALREMGEAVPYRIFEQFVPLLSNPANLPKGISLLKETVQVLKETGRHGEFVRIANEQGLEAALKHAKAEQMLAKSLREVNRDGRLLTATLGSVGLANRELGRTMFWAGLGAMFSAMSYARISNSALAAEGSQLTYMRAVRSVGEAERQINDLRAQGIVTGREYADALLRVREANYGVALSENRVREQNFQNRMAWLMFVFGTAPTIIRAYSDIQIAALRTAIAKKQLSQAEFDERIVRYGLKVATDSLTASYFGLTLSVKGLTYALYGLSLGLPLILTFLGQMSAQSQAEKQIKDIKDEFAALNEEFNRPGSPTFLQSLDIIVDRFDKINKGVPSFGGSGISLPGSIGGPSSVVIQMSGPVYMNSERDVANLANKLKRKSMDAYRRLGGYEP